MRNLIWIFLLRNLFFDQVTKWRLCFSVTHKTTEHRRVIFLWTVIEMAAFCKFRNISHKTLLTSSILPRSSSVLQTRNRATALPVREKAEVGVELKPDGVLDFDNFQQAFKSKTTLEILRALMVFRLCSFDFLVDNNKKVWDLPF